MTIKDEKSKVVRKPFLLLNIVSSFLLLTSGLRMMCRKIKQSLGHTINHSVFFVNKLICRQCDMLQSPQMFRFEMREVAGSKDLINEL